MKTKLIQFVPALFAVVAIGFRYFSNWCIDSIPSCYGTWIHQEYQYLTSPLYSFSFFVLPITLILVLVSRSIFNSWLKLAAWAIPLSVLFIATTHVNSNAFMDFFPFYRDDAARLAGGVFAATSFLLIAWKHFSARRMRQI